MRVNGNRLYHTGLKPIKRSTFCDALEKRPNGLFENVFTELADKAQGIAGKMRKKFANPLRIIDASIMSLCLTRFNWAKYRKAKGAVKLHLNLDGDNCIPFDAYLTNGKVHEAERMQNLTLERGVLYVMDRGYIDYKSLYSIELQDSIFVTRMKTNCAYRKIKTNPCNNEGSVLTDVLIELTGPQSKEHYPEPLRKIKYQDPETKKVYEFLTNDMEREAEEVAMIYKERWEVELFFKWIKQHLRIKSFWGTSMNAVYSQIWVALILTILLWIAKTLDGIAVSTYELLIMMKSTLLTKNSLTGLCTNITQPKPPILFCQPFLEGFKC
jgi:transposase